MCKFGGVCVIFEGLGLFVSADPDEIQKPKMRNFKLFNKQLARALVVFLILHVDCKYMFI